MDALDFGKYAVYIWAAYGLTALVLIINVAYPVLNFRKSVKQFRAQNALYQNKPSSQEKTQ